MEVKFKRAEDSLYPQIYYTFTAKDESDELTDYYVQDLTEQYFDEAIDVIARYLMPEETFSLAARIPESETAVNGFRNFYRKLVEQKLSLACFKKGSDNIVAVNVLIVEARGFESSSKVICDFTKSFFNIKHFELFRLTIQLFNQCKTPSTMSIRYFPLPIIITSITFCTAWDSPSALNTEAEESQLKCLKLAFHS